MKKIKNRKQKELDYINNYSHIPTDFNERLDWMYDEYNITEKEAQQIIDKKIGMLNSLYYTEILIKLFEEPEGTPRPRFRLVNRKNFVNEAMNNGNFVHVYQPNAKDDNMYMKRLVDQDLLQLNQFIYTPCIVEYNVFLKTPKSFPKKDIFLAEIGIIRPPTKPDWDNIGKKYSDMLNGNVWLDDTLVISGTVNKYYSILPRVEIRIRYLNMLYNRYQYNSINKKIEQEAQYYGKRQETNTK